MTQGKKEKESEEITELECERGMPCMHSKYSADTVT